MRKFLRIMTLRERTSIGCAFNVLKDTRGNAAIEFALVVPIFTLVFVASVDAVDAVEEALTQLQIFVVAVVPGVEFVVKGLTQLRRQLRMAA